LTSLGYRTSVRSFTDSSSYIRALAKAPRTQPQAGINGWFADYPAPSNFFSILSCRTANDPTANPSLFCSRSLDHQIDRALALQSQDQAAAATLWTEVDRKATNAAAIVPMYTLRSVDLVSKRVGNYQHHPLWGVLLDQLWVQ
jgi:peptide/nickel transport system substrate-binding protein